MLVLLILAYILDTAAKLGVRQNMYDIYVLNSLSLSMPTSGKKLIYYNTLCQMLHISFIRNVDKLDMVHTYNYWKGLILDLPLKVFNFIVFLKVFNFIVFFKGKISPFLNLFKLSYSPSHIFRDFKMTLKIFIIIWTVILRSLFLNTCIYT